MVTPMTTPNIDNLVERIMQALPAGWHDLKQDVDQQLQAALRRALNNMNLVTRDEFDVQSAVLARSRAKLEALEQQVAELESLLAQLAKKE